MDRAGFRDFAFPLDHPQVARLQGKDAHAQAARGSPRAQELLIEPWAPEGPYGDAVLFADEERMGPELMASPSPGLRRQAVVYDLLKDPAMPAGRWHQADQRHLGGAFRDNRVIPYEGVRVSEFRHRLAAIERHLDDTYFCWIGETDGEHPFYYRIQSPVIMIEFDEHAGVFLSNEEPERFHIHTIVRTPNGNDYGMDLLRMHYAQAHPGHRPGT